MASHALHDVHAESTYPYFSGGSSLAEFWKMSWTRIRDGEAAAGVDVSEWDRDLAELDDTSRIFIGPMTVSVWATKQ